MSCILLSTADIFKIAKVHVFSIYMQCRKPYSRLMTEDETATVKTLAAYREVITSLINQHRDRVVDSPGDNVLA